MVFNEIIFLFRFWDFPRMKQRINKTEIWIFIKKFVANLIIKMLLQHFIREILF